MDNPRSKIYYHNHLPHIVPIGGAFFKTFCTKDSIIKDIMQKIKGRSSIRINRLLNLSGSFWQRESFDHWITDDKELAAIGSYILIVLLKQN